ncbi:MAG: hypothetical protein P8M25_01430 [Paracoccaceae bacterium]|nr:hypothetical protein [Paracoccaceae bacterium]
MQRLSEANLRHGRQTKAKLAAQRHAAKLGCRVRGELKRIESQLVAAFTALPPSSIIHNLFWIAIGWDIAAIL